MRLPGVLSPADLPHAELAAARLDGELYVVDGCFVPIDLPEDREGRARAVALLHPLRLIAEQRTAAWIHGALPLAPARHQFCVDVTARTRPPVEAHLLVREVVLHPDDVTAIGGLAVTTPLRTAADLARCSPEFGETERAMVRRLLRLSGHGAAEVAALLDRRRNLPGKRAALARVRNALQEG